MRDELVARYLRDEFRKRQQQSKPDYKFLPPEPEHQEHPLQAEYTEGRSENVSNLRFINLLRNNHPTAAAGRSSSSHNPHHRAAGTNRLPPPQHQPQPLRPKQQQQRSTSASQPRPLWNRNTKHIDPVIDPLQKCLHDNLVRRGFQDNYQKAMEDQEVLRELEAERLKARMAAKEAYDQWVAQQKQLWEDCVHLVESEHRHRQSLGKSEKTIRVKLMEEFRFGFTMLLEIDEYHSRKRLFYLSMQQLDELKVVERESFEEIASYEQKIRDDRLEEQRRANAAEHRRRQQEEFQRLYYQIVRQEIQNRDAIHARSEEQFQLLMQSAIREQEKVLFYEIMLSLYAEEGLQRELYRQMRDAELADLVNRASAERAKIASKDKSAAEQRAQKLQRTQLDESQARREIERGADSAMDHLIRQMATLMEYRLHHQSEEDRRLRIEEEELSARRQLDVAQRGDLEDIHARLEKQKHDEANQQKQQQASQEEERETRLTALRAQALKHRPFLGVTLAERIEPSAALVIDSMYVDGPGDMAGLKLGDILVQVGEHVVNNFVEMREAMKETAEMGKHLSVVVHRDGVPVEASVRIVTADKTFAELTDLYFDVSKHSKISRDQSILSAPSTPQKKA